MEIVGTFVSEIKYILTGNENSIINKTIHETNCKI